MSKRISDIKDNIKKKLLELRMKRKSLVGNFRKKVEEVKIEQIKNSILNK